MDLTRDELVEFARAGGWTVEAEKSWWYAVTPSGDRLCLYENETDAWDRIIAEVQKLEACFDVLERAARKDGRACEVGMCFGGGTYYCNLFRRPVEMRNGVYIEDRSDQITASGDTKQAAIVRAVVAAAKART